METKQLSTAEVEARRSNAQKSTGPRTRRGKRCAGRNALKHGLYSDVQYFYRDAAMELGEDPRDFTRLYQGLLEARRPEDMVEQGLIEDIAILVWKKARLERAESAVQVCNVRKHDLERRKKYLQAGSGVNTVPQAEVLEKGLRGMLDAPGKFEKVITLLGVLEDLTARHQFNDDMHRLLLALYGEKPTMRGVGLLNQYVKLRKMRPEGEEFEKAKTVFAATQAEESVEVLEEYDLFLHEHVENTRAARIAAMAPSHAQWAAIIRQQNALHRQLERKIRLLDEMQERRRRMGSATDLLSRLSAPPDVGAALVTAPPGNNPPSESAQPRDADAGAAGHPQGVPLRDAATPPDVGAALVAALCGPESPQPRGADAGATGHPQGVPLRNTENSGNEARKSLKTNDWVKMEYSKPTHSGARNASGEANKPGFLATRSHPRRA